MAYDSARGKTVLFGGYDGSNRLGDTWEWQGPLTTFQAGVYDVVVSNNCGSVTSDPATLTVNTGPVISVHPAPATVCTDGTVTFSVAASGTEPIDYQWRKDGQDIPGADGASYAIVSVGFEDAGSYDVVVSNTCGSQNSQAAILTVLPIPPGDFDGDCRVNLDDFATFAVCFGQPVTMPPPGCSPEEAQLSDFDGNGRVDLNDFATFAVNFTG